MSELTQLVRQIVHVQVDDLGTQRLTMRLESALKRSVLLFSLMALVGASEPGDRSGIDGFVTGDIAAAVPGATVGIDSRTGASIAKRRQTVRDII